MSDQFDFSPQASNPSYATIIGLPMGIICNGFVIY